LRILGTSCINFRASTLQKGIGDIKRRRGDMETLFMTRYTKIHKPSKRAAGDALVEDQGEG